MPDHEPEPGPMPPLANPYYGSLPRAPAVPEEHAQRRWERVSALLPPLDGLRVLDVGCAEGLLTRKLLGAGAAHVTGVEREAARVEWARHLPEARAGRITFLRGEAQGLSRVAAAHPPEFAEGFDLVTFIGVLQHLPAGDRMAALREVCRRSRDWLLIEVPYASGLKELIRNRKPAWWQVRRVIAAEGFALVKQRRYTTLWRRRPGAR